MFDLSGLYQVLPDQAQPVPVPLVGVEVSAVVRNFIAEVELRQKYQNKENNPLEVTYFFPLEEEASVIGCKALLDGENFLLIPSLPFIVKISREGDRGKGGGEEEGGGEVREGDEGEADCRVVN